MFLMYAALLLLYYFSDLKGAVMTVLSFFLFYVLWEYLVNETAGDLVRDRSGRGFFPWMDGRVFAAALGGKKSGYAYLLSGLYLKAGECSDAVRNGL